MTINDIPAFPNHPNALMGDEGMSLRDYFASAALQALITRDKDSAATPKGQVAAAYLYADAMLELRGQLKFRSRGSDG